jgi:hypothetical protein
VFRSFLLFEHILTSCLLTQLIVATRINGKCDDIMAAVMKELGIPIPSFSLTRRVKVSTSIDTNAATPVHKLTVAGVDLDGTPASIFTSVRIAYDPSLTASRPQVEHKIATEPFTFVEPIGVNFNLSAGGGANAKVAIRLSFFGHYNEPDAILSHTFADLTKSPSASSSCIYELVYNPATGVWSDARALTSEEMKHSDLHTGSGSAVRRTFDDLIRGLVQSGFDVHRARALLQSMNSDLGDGFEEVFKRAAAQIAAENAAKATAPAASAATTSS